MTTRDLVWSAVLDRIDGPYDRVTVTEVHRDLSLDTDPGEDPPARETVRRTMSAMTEAGILEHRRGSPTWRDAR